MEATATAPARPDTDRISLADLIKGVEGTVRTTVREEIKAVTSAKPEAPTALMGLAEIAGSLLSDPARAGKVITVNQDGTFAVEEKAKLSPEVFEAGAAILAAVERPLAGIKILPGINFGAIVVGGVSGVVISEVINGLEPRMKADGKVNTTNIAYKVGATAALAYFGKRVMSPEARNVAVAIMAAQILVDVLPLDGWINKIGRLINKEKFPAEMGNQYRQDAVAANWQGNMSQEAPIGGMGTDQLAGVLG